MFARMHFWMGLRVFACVCPHACAAMHVRVDGWAGRWMDQIVCRVCLCCPVLCCNLLRWFVECCPVLCCPVLCCVVLCCVVLCCVVLCYVVLHCVTLCCVLLCCLVLFCLVLSCCVLYRTYCIVSDFLALLRIVCVPYPHMTPPTTLR